MSNAIFPTLPGLTWDATKKPTFNTRIQTATSGKELRAALWSLPIWEFNLAFEMLREDGTNTELQTLAGFFLARLGSYDSFLYLDPSEHTTTDQVLGAGDDVTVDFRLVRTWAGFIEPIGGVCGASTLYKTVGGVKTQLTAGVDYSLVGTLITLAAPLATGETLSWSGQYYYRVRFKEDVSEFNNFMQNLWELQKLAFVSVK